MINVLLISIGNELLSGQTVNTNAVFLAKNLTKLGFSVKKIVTLPDENESVSNEIREALTSTEYRLIIITGGLGPTWDDSTSKFLANALEVSINLNLDALNIVKSRYLELFREGLVETSEITSAREKMAYLPESTIPINNPVGTAPGIYYSDLKTDVRIYCFPGVPQEMIAMYNEIVSELILLGERENIYYFETKYLTPFRDESLLAPYLQKVREKY
ncbi:MAG: damage-inducible protein CinA, partial [Candidatus Heimdallarchaeota archaeon]|nr:damage-inducible protein CinA [Candidatus Heimdallarchaeota archaeon]